MKQLAVVLFFFSPIILLAQSYNVALIPDSIKKDADMVIRLEETILEVRSPGKLTIREKHAFTILNEEGASHAHFTTYYGKFNTINYVTATLFDANGKELKKVKKKDMADRSVNDQISLINDERAKEFDFYWRTYPYTVEFEEEDDYDGVRSFPAWVPLPAPSIGLQTSRYVIAAPKDYQVRFKNVNMNQKPQVTETGGKTVYVWETSNKVPFKTERFAPPMSEIVPYVLFAPSIFEVEGYTGDMSTWRDYGKFMYQLIKGRDALPDDVKRKVHELTDKLTDPREKILVLYDYLQKNTRYISIQLGIGGWQPFDANYVATKKYGDCKALSNYMVALLKEAGITGKYVEIESGEDAAPMIEDFPCSQFDHVIACVPLKSDTLWLECTSQITPAGWQGSFTGDRKALIIDEEGGHVVSTHRYSMADNYQHRVAEANIDAEGALEVSLTTKFGGRQMRRPLGLAYEVSKEDREKFFNESLNLPTYQVDKISYSDERGENPSVQEKLHVVSPAYASITGKRLFIAPNLFNKTGTRFSPDSARRYDIVFPESYRDIDSIAIKIPQGYTAESVPANTTLNSRFGHYQSTIKIDGEKITYYRLMERNASRFPPSDYQELVKFQEQVYKNDRARIVFVKKD